MNQISRKLRSQSGATMLIALMFMMFCLFVGGSVLASASANGYRVKHLSEQQNTLNQRSAVRLISDEMRAFDAAGNEIDHVLIVNDTKYEVQKVVVGDGGVQTPEGSPVIYRVVAFKAPEGLKMSPLQRLMYETTVWRYLKENNVELTDSKTRVELRGFTYQDGTQFNALMGTAPNCFWYTAETFGGEITIECETVNGSDPFVSYQAEFLCDNTTGRLYDFLISFGEHTTLSVVMNGGIWKETTSDSAAAVTKLWTWGAESYDAQVREYPNNYNIEWDAPEIRKGGN